MSTVSSSPNPSIDASPPTPAILGQVTDTTMNAERATIEESLCNCRIMILDDEETNVLVVKKYLQQQGYRNFDTLTDPRKAVDIALEKSPDVLLLDINMPHINGLDLLRQFNADATLQNIPVIILTAQTATDIKKSALRLGANDFLTKPVDPNDLIPRVRNALVFKSHMNQLVDQKRVLADLVERRTKELLQSREQLILSLARAAEHRDNETANHVLRVGAFAAILAAELGWPPDAVAMIQQAAQLHDVGKIGIPDGILFKEGKLDPDEFDLMRTHCAIGKDIIAPLTGGDLAKYRAHPRFGQNILSVRSSPLLMMAARIAQTHHERWDGTGYPLGLRGEDIPIEGRITAVADVYDALSTKRTYKQAFPREKCFEIMRDLRGTHFDPMVLDAFFKRSEQIIDVQLAFMDK